MQLQCSACPLLAPSNYKSGESVRETRTRLEGYPLMSVGSLQRASYPRLKTKHTTSYCSDRTVGLLSSRRKSRVLMSFPEPFKCTISVSRSVSTRRKLFTTSKRRQERFDSRAERYLRATLSITNKYSSLWQGGTMRTSMRSIRTKCWGRKLQCSPRRSSSLKRPSSRETDASQWLTLSAGSMTS